MLAAVRAARCRKSLFRERFSELVAARLGSWMEGNLCQCLGSPPVSYLVDRGLVAEGPGNASAHSGGDSPGKRGGAPMKSWAPPFSWRPERPVW